MAKRMKEKNERNSSKYVFNIIIVLIFLVLVGGIFYISPNYIREDYEGKTKVFYSIPPLNDRIKNPVLSDFLSKIGLVNNKEKGESGGGKIFGLFKR